MLGRLIVAKRLFERITPPIDLVKIVPSHCPLSNGLKTVQSSLKEPDSFFSAYAQQHSIPVDENNPLTNLELDIYEEALN